MKTVENPRTVAVFYSRGPHYARALRFLRGRYPEAVVTAITPPGYPHEALAGIPDRHLETALNAYPIAGMPGLTRLLRTIRNDRYDLFVVMFPSIKLRFLASFSGARWAYCFGPDGQFLPLNFAPVRLMLGWAKRRIVGHFTYARIWAIVHFQHVRLPFEQR